MYSNNSLCAIMLAAGKSLRSKSYKLLKNISIEQDEKTLISFSIENMLRFNFKHNLLVTGFNSNQLKSQLNYPKLEIIKSENYALGLAYSLLAGFEYAEKKYNTKNYIIFLADMPKIDSLIISAMLELFLNSDSLAIRPYYKNIPGHPVIIRKQVVKKFISLMLKAQKDKIIDYGLNTLLKNLKNGECQQYETDSQTVIKDYDYL